MLLHFFFFLGKCKVMFMVTAYGIPFSRLLWLMVPFRMLLDITCVNHGKSHLYYQNPYPLGHTLLQLIQFTLFIPSFCISVRYKRFNKCHPGAVLSSISSKSYFWCDIKGHFMESHGSLHRTKMKRYEI